MRVVAQVAPGGEQALLAAQPPPRLHAAALMPWNGGNTAVLARALLGIEPLIDAAIQTRGRAFLPAQTCHRSFPGSAS